LFYTVTISEAKQNIRMSKAFALEMKQFKRCGIEIGMVQIELLHRPFNPSTC
jgi:hypothetical protein